MVKQIVRDIFFLGQPLFPALSLEYEKTQW